MPARRTAQETPTKKDELCLDLLEVVWCVTDRRGLYVFDPCSTVINVAEQKGQLDKCGTVADVCYSGVYPISGKKTPVFKLQVLIPAWEEEPEYLKWFVVRETSFRNFADVGFRYENLDTPEKNGCLNVDKQLLDAWSTGVGGTKGQWFKHWFANLLEQSGIPTPSSERENRLAPAEVPVPSVFGGQPAAPPPPAPLQQALPPPPVASSLPTFNRIPAHLQNRPASKCVCVCVLPFCWL